MRLGVGAAVLGLGVALLPGTALADKPGPGPETAGDSLFPTIGNGGYDAKHYDLRLQWFPKTDRIVARTTMTAAARMPLTRFSLDLKGLTVDSVKVNGQKASFARKGAKLRVTPARTLRQGKWFSVSVKYHGVPKKYVDPDGSSEGWVRTADGVAAVNQPVGSMSWFPNNNTVKDKATYGIHLNVPRGTEAASNGRLKSRKSYGKRTTWNWRMPHPMASELAVVSIGQFKVNRYRGPGGIPMIDFIDVKEANTSSPAQVGTNGVIRWLIDQFGAYPYNTGGIIVDDSDLGYALETQSRPFFESRPDSELLVHEFGHQWFGNSVTPRNWKDIWLNEGFATYAEWMWAAHVGQSTPEKEFRSTYQNAPDRFWQTPPGNVGSAGNLYDHAVYTRGAMALHALRREVGSEKFMRILRTWAKERAHRNGTTKDLLALAERIHGAPLDDLFYEWLYKKGKPKLG